MGRLVSVGIAAALVAGLMCGCASTGGPAVRREMLVPFGPEEQDLLARIQSDPYLIQRGDELGVFFMHSEVLNQSRILVLPDGSASFVGVDRIEVAGKPLAWVDSLLTARYAEKMLDPDLSVVVEKSAGLVVYVLGSVESPGAYDLPPQGLGVLSAIALAGGFLNDANKGAIALIRVSPQGYLCREIDLASVKDGRRFDAAVIDLQPYDIIWVSRTAIGDFVAFSKDVIGSLKNYSSVLFDIRAIENPDKYYRR